VTLLAVSSLQPAFSLNNGATKDTNKGKAKADEIADSWEDELLSSSEDEAGDGGLSTAGRPSPASTAITALSPSKASARGSRANTPSDPASPPRRGTRAPPPTPLARSLGAGEEGAAWHMPSKPPQSHFNTAAPPPPSAAAARTTTAQKRPEKQTAVANRLIAGALGVRAQRTEEQRAYDRVVRENERKRIAREREEQANRELEQQRAKAAIWEE
jgi:hypothetical protein